MEPLLTVREAAQLLGIREQTLYLWVSQKRIPFRKIGRLVRFTGADLQEYVDRQRQEPAEYSHERLSAR
jgi:excisionase family DNA binding protein